MAKPKQASLDEFFSEMSKLQPSATPIRPMHTKETPITPTCIASIKYHFDQVSFRSSISVLSLVNVKLCIRSLAYPKMGHRSI